MTNLGGTEFALVDTTFERKVAEMEPAHPPLVTQDSHARKGPWTGNNQLGYSLAFAPDADNQQTVLKLDEWGFPEVWTVSLSLEGFDNLEAFGPVNGFGVRALIHFGVGGATQTIEVDWKTGTQLSLAMNAINVIANYQNLDVGAGEGAGLKLSVVLSRGNRPGNSGAPVRTMIVDVPSGALAKDTLVETVVLDPNQDTGLMLLPPFSTRLTAAPAGSSGAFDPANFWSDDTTIELLSGQGAGSTVVQVMRGSDLLTRGGLSITGQARFGRIRNTSSTNSICFTSWAEIGA